MIRTLRGTLLEKNLDHVVIEASGVGYLVWVPLQSMQALPARGQEVFLSTYLHVREDAWVLYGFVSEEERALFEQCISVSGIGPKLGLALLSGLESSQLISAIQQGDVQRLSKVPGVGKKTSERLVLELRDKMGKEFASKTGAPVSAKPASSAFQGVVSALSNLGYRPADAERAAEKMLADHPDAPLTELLRLALRFLQKDR